MKPRLIGLSGYMGSGKTTAAQILVQYGYSRAKFAAPLKNMLRTLGLSEREIEGDLKELPCERLGGATPRHMMITLGTEWGRNTIHKDLWVKAAMAEADATDALLVFDDVRFPNEAQAIKERGGVIWRIARAGGPNGVMNHESESGQVNLPCDVVFHNTGSIEYLHGLIREALWRYRST